MYQDMVFPENVDTVYRLHYCSTVISFSFLETVIIDPRKALRKWGRMRQQTNDAFYYNNIFYYRGFFLIQLRSQ